MKHHLDNNAHIWSVSIDDPSSLPINLTTRNIVGEDQNENGETKLDGAIAEEGQLQESMNTKDDQNSTRYDDQIENGKNSTFEAEIPREGQLQKLENNGNGESSKQIGDKSTEESQVNGETARDRKSNNPEDFQHGEFLGASNRSMNNINAVNGVGNSNDSQVFETKDEYGDSKAMDSKKHGSIKLEKLNHSLNGEGSRARVTHGFRRKMKAKRWRMTSEGGLKKYEDLEDGKGAKLKGRSFTKDVAKIDKQMLLLREGNLQKLVSHQYYKGLNMREAHTIHQDGNDDIILHENVKLLKPQTFLYGEGLIRNVNGEASGGTTNALEQAEDHAVERQIDIRAETKELMEMKSQKIYEAALAHEKEIADTKSDASSDIDREFKEVDDEPKSMEKPNSR
ncbi:PREDICTED: uncharacterized protein LOC104605665 [Nelumbo nucifera]|uniref:Uncharacterized protein LOC104605665 n=2 Tax=Nelumbo nucifera TaxID=4432 RepID=A0A1U8B015_NELNU|nr:PREDICTED: uncharacterized protein LOC104605665 [Nelumbo nucifera]DAD23032.1 TPA_asm: hypothetical protein HUJ06_024495 [Nelumbo nucifera]